MTHTFQQYEQDTTYPLNAWYAAGWDVDGTRSMLPRTICEKKLVFYRKGNGDPVALDNACWHRLVPLSMGALDGDTVVCAYHGLRFNPDRRCVFMPSQKTNNPSAAARSYPVVERHRFIWVWPGDAAQADPDLVPNLHWNHDPAWAGDGGTIRVDCDYRRVVDNLMDLAHETFVHAGSIGDAAVAESPFQTSHGERTATVTRRMKNITPPPFWAAQLGQGGKVDRWQIIRFDAPATIAIDVGVAPTGTGAPEGDRSKGVNGYDINTMTPETKSSCHYFWGFARNYRLSEQQLSTQLREGVRQIFEQDEIVLNAQQRAMAENPDKIFYNLNINAGSIWARRIIERLIRAEIGPPMLEAAQ